MSNSSVDVRTEADGSLVVQPRGELDADDAVQFRQVLVHAVRKVRPLRLIVDLSAVRTVDPINLGTLVALCDLADDHHVVLFLDGPNAELRAQLAAACVPSQRVRQTCNTRQARETVIAETPEVASMS
jgi:anti-anti-sigma factor